MRTCQPRQDRKVAAVSSHSYVPRHILAGANPAARAGDAFRSRVHGLLTFLTGGLNACLISYLPENGDPEHLPR